MRVTDRLRESSNRGNQVHVGHFGKRPNQIHSRPLVTRTHIIPGENSRDATRPPFGPLVTTLSGRRQKHNLTTKGNPFSFELTFVMGQCPPATIFATLIFGVAEEAVSRCGERPKTIGKSRLHKSGASPFKNVEVRTLNFGVRLWHPSLGTLTVYFKCLARPLQFWGIVSVYSPDLRITDEIPQFSSDQVRLFRLNWRDLLKIGEQVFYH